MNLVFTMQRSFAGGELAPSLYARVDLPKYAIGARKLRNAFCHPHGGASNRPGLEYIAASKSSTQPPRLVPFQFSVTQAYILEFGHQYMRVFMDGGQVTSSGSPVEISTPYTYADLENLNYVQSADTLYLTHPSYPAAKITRNSHTSWTYSVLSFQPVALPPTSVAVSTYGSGSVSYSYVVTTTLNDTEEESIASSVVTCTNSLSTATYYNTITWAAATNAKEYNVYKLKAGRYGLIGVTSSLTFKDDNITADTTDCPPETRDPISTASNYPGVATFFEQRLCFARSDNKPQTIWMTQTSKFNNMNVSSPLKDDDACTFTIAALNADEIRWMVPLNDLLIGTSSGEWKLAPGANASSVSPTSVQIRPQGYRGSAKIRPIVVGNSLIFLQGQGNIVRDLTYDLSVDGYTGNNLSVLAPHFTRDNKIVDWAFQQSPDSIIWMVRDDGKLLGLTYMKEHDVWGWHLHSTDGLFKAVARISTPDADETWFVVQRTLNGSTVNCIERFRDRLPNLDVAESFFVDCGLTYRGTAATTISGLTHLVGKTVSILADGNVVPQQVVSGGGTITLPHSASVVHVGLPYTSEVETLDVLAETQSGTLQGQQKRIAGVTVRVENTRALWIGPGESPDRAIEVPFRSTENYGEAVALYTGDKEIKLDSGYTTSGRVYIKNTDPLPMTVLAVIPRLVHV